MHIICAIIYKTYFWDILFKMKHFSICYYISLMSAAGFACAAFIPLLNNVSEWELLSLKSCKKIVSNDIFLMY